MNIKSAFRNCPWAGQDVREMRMKYPNILAPYLDHEIGQAYHIYSEDFHAAGWQGESDWKDFIEWMTESPIEGIVKRGKSEAQ